MDNDEKKRIMAKSTAEYRGVQIYETEQGCALFLAGRRYDPKDLGEATALIDAAYEAMGTVLVLPAQVLSNISE